MQEQKTNLIGVGGRINSGKDLVAEIIQFLMYENYYGQPLKFLHGSHIPHIPNQFQNKKFADKLKDITCLLLGCTREQLEDRNYKEKELREEWWYYKGETGLFPYNTPYEANKKLPLVKLTPRLLLQLLGTQCGREIIHPNLWVNSLFADYYGRAAENDEFATYPNWIISDMRFPNELESIKGRNGITIRVERYKQIENLQEGDEYYVVHDVPSEFEKTVYEPIWTVFDDQSVRNCHEFETKEEALAFCNAHESETALDRATFDYTVYNDGTIEDLVEKVRVILTELKII